MTSGYFNKFFKNLLEGNVDLALGMNVDLALVTGDIDADSENIGDLINQLGDPITVSVSISEDGMVSPDVSNLSWSLPTGGVVAGVVFYDTAGKLIMFLNFNRVTVVDTNGSFSIVLPANIIDMAGRII